MSVTSHCRAWRMLPTCARRTRMHDCQDRRRRGEKAPGVIAVVTGAELAKVMTPWVGVLTHLKGLKSAPQSPSPSTAPAGRARRSAPWWRARAPRQRTAANWSKSTYEDCRQSPILKPRSRQDAGDPRFARRQSLLRAQAGRGAVDKAFAEADTVVEATFFRTPYRRDQRAARRRRRLERGREAHDRLSRHAGAAHDAEPVRQASRARPSIRCA